MSGGAAANARSGILMSSRHSAGFRSRCTRNVLEDPEMNRPHIIAALVLAAAAAPLAAQSTMYALGGNTSPSLRRLDAGTGATLDI
jgi:hypothetical protein